MKLVNSIDDKVQKGILLDIKEVIDASNEDVVNIQIVLKKGANPDLVISNLLAKTDLQTNFNYNMNTILNKKLNEKPTGILDCLYEFINHGLDIIKRRTQYDIEKLNKRVLILEGLLTILNDLEQALEIIKSNDDPKEGLESMYGLNDEQTDYILNMKLRRINNQDKAKVEEELNELYDRLPKLLSIVNDEKVALETLKEELAIIKEKFGDNRRTSFDLSSNANITIEDLIVDEDLIITITNEGNIKSVSASAYESQRRGGKGNKGAKIKDDEIIVDLFSVNSKDDILFITNTGRCHVLKAYQIPKVARNAKGKNIVNYLKLDEGEHPVSTLTTNIVNNKNSALTLLTKQGKIKRINLTQLSTKYSYTRIIGLNDNDVVVKALLTDDDSEVLLVTEQGLYVRFPISTVRPQGRSAEGVRAIKFKLDNDSLLTATVISDTDEIITITEQGIGKRSKAEEYSASKNRGGAGFIFYKVNDRVGKVAAVLSISNKEDILITTKNGVVIRIPSDSISLLSRTAMGVKLITLNDNDNVASIAKIIPNKDEEGEEVDSE